MNNKTQAVFGLSRIPQIGPRRLIQLVDYFGQPEQVWLASKREIMNSRIIPASAVEYLLNPTFRDEQMAILQKSLELGLEVITYFDQSYPGRLKQIPDPPIVLFADGETQVLSHSRSVAIVGTREPTPYGIDIVRKCVRDLAPYNPHIVSGLAYGIDAEAHRSALKHHLKTTAVMANGLGVIYPFAHRGLAKKILANGCLLTEYDYDTKAEREFFPMRNRIVAGLVDLVLVIESQVKGGSMITAWMANEYQREVATFPGSVFCKNAMGPHHLIKTHQAHLIDHVSDIVSIMKWKEPDVEAAQLELFAGLSPQERRVVDTLRAKRILHTDQLSEELQMDPGQLAMILLQLELNGCVRSMAGSRWCLSS